MPDTNTNHHEGSADLGRTLEALGETIAPDVLAEGWDESMRTMPPVIPFLEPEHIRFARDYCTLDAATEQPLVACATGVAVSDPMRRLAWHAVRCLFDAPTGTDFARWPTLAGEPGFYLVIALAMVPRVIETHRELGIEPGVTRRTCRQVACFAGNYRRAHRDAGQEAIGIFRRQLYWLRHYTQGRLFRLGRFEYMLKQHDDRFVLFRYNDSCRYLALAPDGRVYDDEGLAVSTGAGQTAAEGVAPNQIAGGRESASVFPGTWLSRLSLSDERAEGYPIDPAGRALRQRVTLDLGQWHAVLKAGDTVIDLHIPADGRMPIDACAESLRSAVDFFARHFPDRPAVSVWSSSWIFGPQLEKILPPQSNLVRFLRQGYLAPVPSGGKSLWFIYLDDAVDRRNAPRDNSLQAAVSDFLAQGGVWRDASMAYPVDMLPAFGTEPFRRGFAPACELAGCTSPQSRLS